MPGIKNDVISAKMLATGQKVRFEKTDDGKVILKGMPTDPPDPYDSVIALELYGLPKPYNYDRIPL